MDLLKRSLAPVTDAAWNMIEEQVRRTLTAQLSGRKVVDVVGPKGWDHAAVGLGRLDVPRRNEVGGVRFGIHQVQPLVEARVQFELSIWELDNAVRGAEDVDLQPAEEAAQRIAAFEDGALFNGFAQGRITGIAEAASHTAPLDLTPPGYLESVSGAVLTLKDAGVEGPYALLVGPKAFRALASRSPGYPLERQVRQLIDGNIVYSRVIDGWR